VRFFLDTSVLLARLFEEFKSRIQKFQRNVKEHSLRCLVSSSVAEEGEEVADY